MLCRLLQEDVTGTLHLHGGVILCSFQRVLQWLEADDWVAAIWVFMNLPRMRHPGAED